MINTSSLVLPISYGQPQSYQHTNIVFVRKTSKFQTFTLVLEQLSEQNTRQIQVDVTLFFLLVEFQCPKE